MLLCTLGLLLFHTSSTLGRPRLHQPGDNSTIPDVQQLLDGNVRFMNRMHTHYPGFLKNVAHETHAPDFLFFGCSDSRTSEGTLFDTLPGQVFVQRNIANLYSDSDPNANAVLTYAVSHLGVSHIIVMGHYGCGAVATAITSPISPSDASDPVQSWILPIKELYATSNRSEVTGLRSHNRVKSPIPAPSLHDSGFRALVEENVKANVHHMQKASIFAHHQASSRLHAQADPSCTEDSPGEEGEHCSPERIMLHGWVYDMETGHVTDLGVTVEV